MAVRTLHSKIQKEHIQIKSICRNCCDWHYKKKGTLNVLIFARIKFQAY